MLGSLLCRLPAAREKGVPGNVLKFELGTKIDPGFGYFSHRFFDLVFIDFLLILAPILALILESFSCFLHHFFEHGFCIVFYWFFN